MTAAVEIRPERSSDVEAIGELIESAFLGMPYADGDEAELVEALRAENALSVSLVAERDGMILGQIAFSPARAPGGAPGWYALGPVAVLPAHQGGGIGSALVRAGLQAILELGAEGCILTGDPAYYRRFGFALSARNAPPGEPAEFFMIKLLRSRLPVGPIHFHGAFGAGEIRIREATASDHAICAEILSSAWNSAQPTHLRQVEIREFREQTLDELLLVAVNDRGPIGFVSVWKPSWFVHHLFVEPASQGHGVGSRLLGHVSTLAGEHTLSLKVQTENRAAIRFYERHGFRRTALRGEDSFGEWIELRVDRRGSAPADQNAQAP